MLLWDAAAATGHSIVIPDPPLRICTRIERPGDRAVDVGLDVVPTGLSNFSGRNPAVETGCVVVTAVGIVGAERDLLIQAPSMFALT